MSCQGDILVVDDEYSFRETLKDILEANRYRVCLAKDCQEAVESVKKWHYRLVIMDISMPRKDGLEALGEMRDVQPNMPVAMVMAFRLDRVKQQVVMNSSLGLFTKPLDLESFLKMVATNCPR